MESIMKENNVWTTSDFYSAVLVRASGIPLADLVRETGRFITFQFNAPSSSCEAILKQHWDRALKLETRLLIETINELKTRVHEKLKGDLNG